MVRRMPAWVALSLAAACGGDPPPELPGQAAVIATAQPLPGHDSICQMPSTVMSMGDPASGALDTGNTHDDAGEPVLVVCFVQPDRLNIGIGLGNEAGVSVIGHVPPRSRDSNGVPDNDQQQFPNVFVSLNVDQGQISLQQSDCYAQYVDLAGNPLPAEADVIFSKDGTYSASAWFSVFCNDAQNTGVSNPNILVCQTATTIRVADCAP